MSRLTPFVLCLAGVLAIGAGCQNDKSSTSAKSSSSSGSMSTSGGMSGGTSSSRPLWDRLGGEPAVRAVVHDFVDRGAKDTKVNFTRKGHPNEWKPTSQDLATLEQRLVEFISKNTGGPLSYSGRDMVTVHTGMEIKDSEFNALAADLGASLDKFKVPKREKDELIAVVASTRSSIVNK